MWKTCAPEEAGVRSEGILAFVREMEEKHLHLHALMMLRHGQVIARADFAPYSQEHLHMLFSLSKSFTSTAVGFAVQDGLLTVEDHLVDFFPELLPAAPCENMQKIRIRHLLTMNTGHTVEPSHPSDCWERDFLHSYVPCEPGTHFLYNTAGTYMLAAVVQRVTGKKLLAYLREKLMDPLGMSPDIWFEESPSGVATGGFGLNVHIEDIAKLGQFYLQGGQWNGVQLLSEDWIRDAQQPWSDNRTPDQQAQDWVQGYGYQFWMCQPDHVFRGDGAFGQYCVIMPDQDMVIAINSGVEDMQAVLQSLWDHVLPAVGEPVPAGEAAEELARALAHPVIPARWEEMGETAEPPRIPEAWQGTYALQENPFGITELSLTEDQLTLQVFGEKCPIPLGRDVWQPCRLKREDGSGYSHGLGLYPCGAARAAIREGALLVQLIFTETPFEEHLKLCFTAHGLRMTVRQNVGFGDNGELRLLGVRCE